MCTLTWWSDAEGRYEVFFNRDEKKDREPAVPPVERERNGVRYLAPIDPRGGGSWLMVNETGVTVALLNWYEREVPQKPPGGWRSRGQIVLDLADVTNAEDIREQVRTLNVSEFPPFRLMAFSPDSYGRTTVSGWEWSESGKLESMMPVEMPVCSSSFETEQVIAGRKMRLLAFMIEDGVIDPGSLCRYHHSIQAEPRAEAPSAWTVRMNRPDAQTWSISQIRVSPEDINFIYEAEALDFASECDVTEILIPRKARS